MADLIERKKVLEILRIIGHGRPISGKRAISLISEMPSASMWIPCSERLPENDANCLVYTSDKRIRIARWYGKYDEQGVWYIISEQLYRIKNVPFWMPLPEPPKRGADNGTA